MPPTEAIIIKEDGGNIVAHPEKKHYKPGTHTVRWIPDPTVTVTDIAFTDPKAPISKPVKQHNGHWTATNVNSKPGTYAYIIDGSVSGSAPVTLDPEIVNDPPGGVENGEG